MLLATKPNPGVAADWAKRSEVTMLLPLAVGVSPPCAETRTWPSPVEHEACTKMLLNSPEQGSAKALSSTVQRGLPAHAVRNTCSASGAEQPWLRGGPPVVALRRA